MPDPARQQLIRLK